MILSGLEYDPTLINRILSQECLMDVIMRESSFAQYIKQQGREEGFEQGAGNAPLKISSMYWKFDLI